MISLGRLRGADGRPALPSLTSPPRVTQPLVPGQPFFQASGYVPKLPNGPRYLTQNEQNVAIYSARLAGGF